MDFSDDSWSDDSLGWDDSWGWDNGSYDWGGFDSWDDAVSWADSFGGDSGSSGDHSWIDNIGSFMSSIIGSFMNSFGQNGQTYSNGDQISHPSIYGKPGNVGTPLSEYKEEIEQSNPNVTVSILGENRIQITANSKFNDKVTLEFLGIELNGDIIVIEQVQYYDKNGIGTTDLSIHLEDELFTWSGAFSKEEVQKTQANGMTTKEVIAGEGGLVINHISMDLGITIKSDGTFIASARAEYGANPQRVESYARIVGGKPVVSEKEYSGPFHDIHIVKSWEFDAIVDSNQSFMFGAIFNPMGANPMVNPGGNYGGFDRSYINIDFSKYLR